jgi:hypothetical protein
MNKQYKILFCSAFLVFAITGCTIYTEKRSEALSQAVYATATSITNARIDFAVKYSEQAKRLAYPPKNEIKVSPIITQQIKKIKSVNNSTKVKSSSSSSKTTPEIPTNVITITSETEEEETVLRLVVPEFLKHAKILIENSEEWNELIKTKKIKDQLELDNANLKKLAQDIDDELTKQLKFNTKMVEDLNKLQLELAKKKLLIMKLYITIATLVGLLGGGIYLRMKGVL